MDLYSLSGVVDEFIRNHGGYWDIPWLLAAMTEELGELSRALQTYSRIRDVNTSGKEKSNEMLVEEECGDLFFALIYLTNFLGINLETALFKSLTKYDSRKK
ncbi:MAG: MazG nucleotide pyrophosphohydrolase domain-containing protein [Candidatus Hodarchaeales archaeon]|jgi:NTP pyrophosphatase (non-canonical NTP hydrolase)